MKLSPSQIELLVAMSNGERVLLGGLRERYWFRTGTMKRISSTVSALRDKKLAVTASTPLHVKLELTDLGRDIAHAHGGPARA